MSVEDKNKNKKQEEDSEETLDDLVDEEFQDISQGDVVTRVATEPTILSEEVEEKKIYFRQQRDIPRSPESELEETASEAPTPRRENIEYELTSPLDPITHNKDEEPDLKYHPEKLYEPKYRPDEIGKIEKKKDEKIYTTKREIIS